MPAQRPMFERLETRTLLSASPAQNIVWVNERRSDGFNTMYGASAETARTIVESALADWRTALSTIPGARFNYRITIVATDIERGSRHSVTLGQTAGTSIQLDRDGAGNGWYFDPSISDNSEITQTYSPFAGDAAIVGRDFYTVALHELGHALGFVDRTNPYSVPTKGRAKYDVHHTNDTLDLMTQVLPVFARRLISNYDINHTAAARTANSVAPVSTCTLLAFAGTTNTSYIALTTRGLAYSFTANLFRSEAPISDPSATGVVFLGSFLGNTFIDKTADVGKTYYYLLQASNSKGVEAIAQTTGYRAADSLPIVESTTDGTHITVTWQPVQNATSYQVWRADVDDGNPTDSRATQLYSQGSNNQLVDDLAAFNKYYYYWVTANFGDYYFGTSALLNEHPIAARRLFPPADNSVAATETESPVKITWNPVPDAMSYQVFRATSMDGVFEPAPGDYQHPKIAEVTGTSFTDTGADPGTRYYYVVDAVFSAAYISALSRISSEPVVGVRKVPPFTASVSATRAMSMVTVHWDAVPNAQRYEVYRADTNINDSVIDSAATVVGRSYTPDVFDWTDYATEPGKGYYYWVTADFSTSNFDDTPVGSRVVLSQAPMLGYTSLPSPQDILVSTDQPLITVSWNAPNVMSNDTGPTALIYQVFRSHYLAPDSSLKSSNASLVGAVPAIYGTFVDFSAPPATDLFYWIVESRATTPELTLTATGQVAVGSRTAAAPYGNATLTSAANTDTTATGFADGIAVRWKGNPFATTLIYRSALNTGVLSTDKPEFIVATYVDGRLGYTDTTAVPGVLYTNWLLPGNYSNSPFLSDDVFLRAAQATRPVAAT